MRFHSSLTFLLFALLVLATPDVSIAKSKGDDAFLGPWDITIPAAGKLRARYCWLEVTKEGGTFKGRFNSGGGAVFPLKDLSIAGGELKFQHPFGKPGENLAAIYQAKIEKDQLVGSAAFGKQAPRGLTGVRGPKWPAKAPKRKPGKPIELFNGKDLSGWLGQNTGKPTNWKVQDGIMVNGEDADNIFTEGKFRDFKLEVEFNVSAKSNSGIYLRGRYEIQVMDGAKRPLDVHSQGAVYGFIPPSVNVDKPAGEWQKYEITLIANRATIVLNGTKIVDNFAIPGITGGALDANEKEPGPIMLQGDHGLVQYRKVTLTPLE